jgi:branched-chain amino acid transport system permease protein
MTWKLAAGCIVFLGIAAALPLALDEGGLRFLTECLLMLVMAQMWNLCAGYGGLVSFGHQVFVGLGAYALFLTSNALNILPYWALPAAPIVCALVAAIVALPLFRLREAYFAIGMWVFSEIIAAIVIKSRWMGGTAGVPLSTKMMLDFDHFEETLFWIAAAAAALAVAGTLVLMRSRFGLGLMTVRDNDFAAATIGVDVQRNRFVAFVISAAGCGFAGAMSFLGTLFVTPLSAFDVTWVVDMMFIVIIGGIGTLEGPILGVVIYFALREVMTDVFDLSAGWFLIALGFVAVATMLLTDRGLWPVIAERLDIAPLRVRRRPPTSATIAGERRARAAAPTS